MKKSIKIILGIVMFGVVMYACQRIEQKKNNNSVAESTADASLEDTVVYLEDLLPEDFKDEPCECFIQCPFAYSCISTSPCSCTCFENGYPNCLSVNGTGSGDSNKSSNISIFVSNDKLQNQNDLYHFLLDQLNQPAAAHLVFLIRELFINNNNKIDASPAIEAYYEYASAYNEIFITFSPEVKHQLIMLGIDKEKKMIIDSIVSSPKRI